MATSKKRYHGSGFFDTDLTGFLVKAGRVIKFNGGESGI